MRTALLVIFAVGLSAIAAPVPKAVKARKTDAELLEGKWEGVSIEGDHGPQPYTMFLLVKDGKIGISEKNDNSLVPDEPITDPELRARVEDEFGDVLLVVANLARRWKINPEEALRKSNAKFERRVRFIEEALKAQCRSIRDATLIEMEELYQTGKRQEPKTDSRP